MNTPSLSRYSVGFVLCAAALAQAPAANQRSPEDLLPASSYASVRFGGLDGLAQAADQHSLAQIVEAFLQKLPAETRQRFLEQGMEQAVEHLQAHLGEVGLSANTLRNVLRRPMALGLGRLTVRGMGPSAALVIDTGEARADVEELLQVAARLAQGHGASIHGSDVEVAGMKMRSMQFEGGPEVLAGSLGHCYVITNSRGYLHDMAAVAAGRMAGLATTSLGAQRQQLPQAALVSLFLNTRPFCSMFDEHLPYEAAEFGRALGVDSLDGTFLGTSAGGGGTTDVLHLGLGGDPSGLMKACMAVPADLQFAQFCSANTVAFMAHSLDVPAAIDAFGRLLEALPDDARAQARRGIGRNLQRSLRRLGTSPQEAEALLRSFGNQVGLAFALEKGAVPKPELLAFVAVKNWQNVAALLGKLEQAVAEQLHAEWKTRQAGDAEIRFFNLKVEDKLQLSPCYARTSKGLLLASDANAMVRALNQAGKQDEALAAQADFASAAQVSAGASGLVHLRLFRAAELGWRSVETMAYPQLDEHADEVGFTSEALPDQEAVARALGTLTWSLHVDRHGVGLKSHGSLGLGAVLAAMGRAADEVLQRAGGKIY
jgi:hypothetical protein